MTKRRDFVAVTRPAMEDIASRFDGNTFKLLVLLIWEADYRTGVVPGSMTSLARLFGWHRDTFARHLQELGAEVKVTKGVNRFKAGGVQVTRYGEYVGSSGTGSGTGSGTTSRPLGRPDQGGRRNGRGDKTQDSGPSVPSVPSIARERFANDAEGDWSKRLVTAETAEEATS